MNEPNWADQLVAWCALATTVITLVVGIVAVIQLSLIRTQIRQAGEAQTAAADERAQAAAAEHRRLEASVRPHLVLGAHRRTDWDDVFLDLVVENAGVGPALGIQLATTVGRLSELWPNPEWKGRSLWLRWHQYVPAISPGERETLTLRLANEHIPDLGKQVDFAVWTDVSFTDLVGQRHGPSEETAFRETFRFAAK